MKGRHAGFLLVVSIFGNCDRQAVNLMANNARSRSRSIFQQKPSAAGVAAGNRTAKPPASPLSPEAEKWVETTLRKMTDEEMIGQLLFTTYHGSLIPSDHPAFAQLEHDINDLRVGGFIVVTQGSPLGVVKSQAYPTAVLANQLQSKSKIPLLIAADLERGSAMRLDEGTSFPTQMAVAAGGRPQDAYTMGKITALEARAAGVNWVYAPVADINNNPGNPIINTRSFGEDPARVAQFVAQFVRGVQDNGALATAMNACGMFGYWGLFTWIPAYLSLPAAQGGRGLGLVKTTSFFLVLCAGKWVGYALFGFFGDAYGRRKPYFTYLLVAAALVPMYGLAKSPFWLLVLGPLVAFFGTGFFSGFSAIASEIFPGEIRASAMGLSYNIGRGLSAAAPFAVGALARRYGLGPALFLPAAGFFVAALLALALPETRGKQLE